MKKIKRWMYFSLALLLLVSSSSFSVAAIDDPKTDYSSNQVFYINGKAISRTTSSANFQGGCHRYEHDVYTEIWGMNFYSKHSNIDNMVKNLADGDRTVTIDHLKGYINRAPLGSAIRIAPSEYKYEDNNYKGHSMILVKKSDVGFTTLEGGLSSNNGERRAVRTYTWAGFVNNWSNYRYINYIIWPHSIVGEDNYGVVSAPSKQTYTLYFNANGGSVSQSSMTFTEGEIINGLPTPTRSGYIFKGWSTEQSGSGMVVINGNYPANENMNLYAVWVPVETKPAETKPVETKTYTIYFDANGGEVYPKSMTVMPVAANMFTYDTLPTPTKSGYTFDGWYTFWSGGNCVSKGTTIVLDSDQTLYAHWTQIPVKEPQRAKTFILHFDANGGQVSPNTMICTEGEVYGNLPKPTRNGYIFRGWMPDLAGQMMISDKTPAYASTATTVYAYWVEDPAARPTNATPTTPTTPAQSNSGYWGGWSSWSSSPAYASSSRQVETRTVKVAEGKTEYRYGRYLDASGGHVSWCGKYLESKYPGSATLQYSDWSETRYSRNGKTWTCGACNGSHMGEAYTDSNGRPCWYEYTLPSGGYFWEDSQTKPDTYETQYRYRDWIRN